MHNLENWAWADCQLGNIAKRAQQFNLPGEKRKNEGRKREEEKNNKDRKGEKRKKKERVKKTDWKEKNRKEKINIHIWKRFICIQE